MQLSGFNNTSNRIFDFICLWILPLGYLLLLCALFFLPGRSLHHKLFYGLFSIPSLIALCLRPRELKELIREPVFIALLIFAAWALLSLCWGPSDNQSIPGQFKPALHTLLLFAGSYLLVRHRSEIIQPLLFSAAIVGLIASVYNLYMFAHIYEPGMRLIGAGAFDNPLLSSHIFGFFCAYWLSLSMTCKRRQVLWLSLPAMAVMFIAVIATGSRTPLVALTLAALWLCFICWNRRSVVLLAALAVSGLGIGVLFSRMLIERGDSFRLEIWQMVLQRIAEHPWIGHGYNASLALDPGVGYNLQEPHSFVLGVLYYVGIFGLLPWLFFQAWGLLSSWRYRVQPLFIIASTWLIFGIGAGLTEGGGIISRPKEHWFLLWIPLALIAALSINQRARRLLTLPVKTLKPAAFEQMTANAQMIEEDGLGPKVLRLADGSFLKLFRRRRWYTSGSFNPYSERFAVNSEQLRTLGIPTPLTLGLFRLKDGSSAVHYSPLPGNTLRQVLQGITAPAVRQALVERFGKFMAQLHEQGVYFRSLHLGNVLVLEDGEFGLIDLADMRIYPSSLSLSLRQRNLRHMQRYTEDRRWLFEDHFEALLQGYAVTASKSAVSNLHKQVLAASLPARAH
ncbi:bifunctional O-antigen ligase/aminoglycoside phosphotransferase family protein [Pseudomonas nunensis]|uniref:O-antigen ligase family protein n=1 Tax=Pseudomonas nunensis TaxID=2961896 RepID=A0ABY5EDT1_9PSED|nr:bifunctional O-antigen ligase/aminoglycoside phosphotransferase family protein [Pseudomonas nunensis]KOX99420.1 polymerase [Pseudomonas nunensis]KPN89018.1 polymerase [Pseudomonas nunensis]MCL5226766.1 O-antigen ligase family protein [Pseudomonas nunensis]UTO13346.1 O-antigen ligase family protein [Pseudomonas nunensis]